MNKLNDMRTFHESLKERDFFSALKKEYVESHPDDKNIWSGLAGAACSRHGWAMSEARLALHFLIRAYEEPDTGSKDFFIEEAFRTLARSIESTKAFYLEKENKEEQTSI
jgi:hypothetical protein